MITKEFIQTQCPYASTLIDKLEDKWTVFHPNATKRIDSIDEPDNKYEKIARLCNFVIFDLMTEQYDYIKDSFVDTVHPKAILLEGSITDTNGHVYNSYSRILNRRSSLCSRSLDSDVFEKTS